MGSTNMQSVAETKQLGTDLNNLRNWKRDFRKLNLQIPPEVLEQRNPDIVGLLRNTARPIPELAIAALTLHEYAQEQGAAPVARRMNQGLAVYERIRPYVLPQASDTEQGLSETQSGSHRTILYWELLRFINRVASEGLDAKAEYVAEYIAPVMQYYEGLMQLNDPKTAVRQLLEEKIERLRQLEVNPFYVAVNVSLLEALDRERLGVEPAAIISLPYLARVFLPTSDCIKEWIQNAPKDDIRSFYRVVQRAINAEVHRRIMMKQVAASQNAGKE